MDTSIGEQEESVRERWMTCNYLCVLKMRFMKIGYLWEPSYSCRAQRTRDSVWKKAHCPAHAATAYDSQEKQEESTKNREYPCVSSGS
jgi:hypothetical protein